MAGLAPEGSSCAQAGRQALGWKRTVARLPFCGYTAAGNGGATAKRLEAAVHNVALVIDLQRRLRGLSLPRHLQSHLRQKPRAFSFWHGTQPAVSVINLMMTTQQWQQHFIMQKRLAVQRS